MNRSLVVKLADPAALRRLLRQAVLVALRIGSALSKFALTIYIARYLSLADLGIYGLLVGAATMVPALLGFGLTDWVSRHIVRLSRDRAVPFMVTRLSFSLLLHVVLQPAAWLLNHLLGAPIPWPYIFLIGAILVLEHLGTDLYFLLVARGRALLGSVLTFTRAGIWPPFVIVLGIVSPELRTIDTVMVGWIAALVLSWAIVGALAISDQGLRAVAWRWRWLLKSIPQALPFFLKDIGSVTLLYLDRFLISAFLGLELTGVYTFFWSIVRVAESLVHGLIETHLPDLAGKEGATSPARFADYEKRMYRENALWALLLSAAMCIAVPLILPFVGNAMLPDFLPLFWLIVAGSLVHIAADAVAFVLYARRQDRAFAMIVLFGAPVSAVANLLLVPTVGVYGAALAYVLAGFATLAFAVYLKRRAQLRRA